MALPFVCAWALAGVAAGLSCALATGICSPAAIATAHKLTPKTRPRVFVRGSRIVDSPNHDSTSAIAEAAAFLRCFETMSGGCSRQFVREHPVGDIVRVSPWSRRAADTCRLDTCRPDTCRSEPCQPEAPAEAAPYAAGRRRRQRSAWPRMQP